MKRGVKFLIVLTILLITVSLISLVGAACSSPDDTIMKLFSLSNSHGALWNQAYNYDICCSDIFGADANECNESRFVDIHACDNNKVVGLYSVNNSHAEVQSLDDYTVDVCYGDLDCINDTSAGDTCVDSSREVVVRLFQNTNSHISNASNTNYLIKICCKGEAVVPPPTVGDLYWANMNDVPINKSDLKDSVKAFVNITGIAGKTINYTIWKNVAWWFDRKVAQSSGVGVTIWRAGMKSDGSFSEGNYYFEAIIEGTTYDSRDDLTYGMLAVSATENNSKPSIVIDYPSKNLPRAERRFKVNKNINFQQTAWDDDDDLEITWKFGDGVTKTCIKSQEECDTVHAYSRWGTKDVDLTAKEIGRTQSAEDYTRVFIYNESINVFALITEPSHSSSIPPTFRSVVKFNANESWVSNCTFGGCPTTLPAGVTGCYNPLPIEPPPNNLSCYDLPKSGANGIGTLGGQYDLWFNWTFDEVGTDGGERLGDWIGNYSYAVEFNRTFFTPAYHWAKLKVGYDPK